MKTLFEDGIDKILQGLTTFEEITRVVAPPQLSSAGGKKKVPLMVLEKTEKAG